MTLSLGFINRHRIKVHLTVMHKRWKYSRQSEGMIDINSRTLQNCIGFILCCNNCTRSQESLKCKTKSFTLMMAAIVFACLVNFDWYIHGLSSATLCYRCLR